MDTTSNLTRSIQPWNDTLLAREELHHCLQFAVRAANF